MDRDLFDRGPYSGRMAKAECVFLVKYKSMDRAISSRPETYSAVLVDLGHLSGPYKVVL